MAAPTALRPDRLDTEGPTAFALTPDAGRRREIASILGLSALKKLAFLGEIAPDGRRDWRLTAALGATVVQPCGVTLEPVVTRIDEAVSRRFLLDWAEPEGDEVEMPEDDTAGPIPAVIDLEEIMLEALALAIPPYPRAPGLEPVEISAQPPGAAAIDAEGSRPFAALAALRDSLDDAGD